MTTSFGFDWDIHEAFGTFFSCWRYLLILLLFQRIHSLDDNKNAEGDNREIDDGI